MKKTLLVSTLIVFVLTGCSNEKDAKIAELSRKIEEQKIAVEKMSAQTIALAEKNVADTYELQERCSNAARKFIAANPGLSSGSILFGYVSHYNHKLNKCFVMTTLISDEGKSKNLFDANSNKGFASLIVFNRGTPPDYYQVAEVYCSSEHEWDSLIRAYMEE